MKTFNNLSEPSPLPLVNYGGQSAFSRDHIKAIAGKIASGIEDKHGPIPQNVVESVLSENLRRRQSESQASTEHNFDEAGWLHDEDELAKYTQLRQKEVSGNFPPIERINTFLDAGFMRGYEFYARLRDGETDISDVSFVRECFELVLKNREELKEVKDEACKDSSPKVLRTIFGFGVVTTKYLVGTAKNNSDITHFKSRQAGVVDLSKLRTDDREIIEAIANHNPTQGRTDKLVEKRAQAREIVDAPGVVLPLVESDYMSRQLHR